MSEDKRKQGRLQGRFSNNRESQPIRGEREKRKFQKKADSDIAPSCGVEKTVRQIETKAAEGISLEYKHDASHSFKEYETKRKPEELRFSGYKKLSETENGISSLIYEPDFMHEKEADEYMALLRDATKWHDKNIILHGNEYPQPRLVAWYGPLPYSYSGATLDAAEMSTSVVNIKLKVEKFLSKHNIGVNLNSVLLNLYRNEKDSVAWHSDDEQSMGVCPTIASVSLGTVRRFEMRPKLHVIAEQGFHADTVYSVNLTPGSLIIMDGCMQKDWMHRVPKNYHDTGPRINLTFRTVFPIHGLPPEVTYNTSRIPNNETKSHDVMKVRQSEPFFDSESFPPLEPSNKHKISSNETPSIAPPVQSCDNIALNEYAGDSQNPNNVNDTVTVDDLTQSFNGQSTDLNVNLNEMGKSYDAKLPLLDDAFNLPDVSQRGRPDGTFAPNAGPQEDQSYQHESQISHYSEPDVEIKVGNLLENKPHLNTNAPSFVPQGFQSSESMKQRTIPLYDNLSLPELSSCYLKNEVDDENMQKFVYVITEKVMNEPKYFSRRDEGELELLCELIGTQTHKHQKLILDRFCLLIEHAEEYWSREAPMKSQYRYPNQRQSYNRDNHNNKYRPTPKY